MLTTALSAVLFAPATLIAIPQEPASQGPTFQQRLEALVERLEDARVREHIPGMALAVVRGDEVVLTHGFGAADLESGKPVTSETIFGVGSTTKAFTATVLGMLADDGVVAWDDAVSEHLPYFELDTGDSGEQATLRDLLSHRSGFTRMSVLSMNPEVSRELILETAARAEPWGRFREDFHYNNVMFLAAGVAAGAAAGSTWEELVTARIFEPLEMSSSSATFRTPPALATGYLWNEDTGEYDIKPTPDIDTIGPAGGITSNVIDMAQWLRLQLGRGALNGNRLISEGTLEATWTNQIQIGSKVSYGLGWFLREWQGQPLIEHGGNSGGFAAQVAFLPDAGLGYVLLTNVAVTPLQLGSMNIVFDTLLGDWQAGMADAVTVDNPEDHLGKYVADFGAWKDDRFTVQIKGDRLTVDVPGQMAYELKSPDEDGKWYFALTDEIAVSFERDDAGDVIGLTMYQQGFSFELPREGYEIPVVIPLEDLHRYLGNFESDDGTAKAVVVIQNNRLALDVPDEMVFELHPPDESDRWVFRARSNVAVSFEEGDGGQVRALTMHQAGVEKTLGRVADAAAEALPTIADIMALRKPEQRLAALDASNPRRVRGTVRLLNSGLDGAYEMIIDGRERYSGQMDFGLFGIARTTVVGDRGWIHDPLRGVTPITGDELQLAILDHPVFDDGDWRDTYDTVFVLGVEEEDGRQIIAVRAKRGDLPSRTYYVDADTGDLVRIDSVAVSDVVEIPVTTRYEAYREVEGQRVPTRIVIENEWNGRMIIQLEEFAQGVEFDPARFEQVELGKR